MVKKPFLFSSVVDAIQDKDKKPITCVTMLKANLETTDFTWIWEALPLLNTIINKTLT